jgi:uridylate kinase
MDPAMHPEAKKFDVISYHEVLMRDLKVMDASATALCNDNSMPIIVFNMTEQDVFKRALMGESVGTTVIREENNQ